MGFSFSGTLELGSAQTDNPSGGENLELTLALAEATYDRAHRPGRIDVASASTQVAWDASEASSQMATFDVGILVNNSKTVPLQVGMFVDPGGAGEISWATELPAQSFMIIYGAVYTSAFAGGATIAYQAGGPDGNVERIEVYAQGGSGSYTLYLFGN